MEATKQITLKITLDKDIRRLTVDSSLSWEKLQAVLFSTYKARTESEWKRTLVRYQDDEGDLCTISSDEELAEAMSLSAQSARPILRLALSTTEVAETFANETLPEPQLTSLLQTLLDNAGRVAPHVGSVFNNLAQTFHQAAAGGSPAPEASGALRHGGRHCWGLHNRQKLSELANEGIFLMDAKDYASARAKFTEQLNMIRRPWHRNVPLYNIACCDALMGDVQSALSYLEQAIQAGYRDADHMKNDEDLASLRELPEFAVLLEKAAEQKQPLRCPGFNKPCFAGRKEWFELQQQALALMETRNPEDLKQARELFEKQVKLSPHPWGQRIPLYNIACCEALLGNTEQALGYLRESVTAGYRNLRHIEGDSDLDSLRESDAYKEIIASVKSGHRCRRGEQSGESSEQTTEQPAEQTVEQPAEQSVEQPQPVEQQTEQVAEQLAEQPAEQPAEKPASFLSELPREFEYLKTQLEVLAQMGFVEMKQNLAALVSAKGDVTQALDKLLNQ